MKKFSSIFLLLLILSGLMITLQPGTLTVSAQANPPAQNISQKVETLFASMTPAERVGQLFLVSFQGTDTSDQSSIYRLINDYHIGGVILMSANDNFTGSTTTEEAYSLIKSLQSIGSQNLENQDITAADSEEDHYIPLFAALSQEGDGYPYDQILNGLTALPNQMAIGATWSPDLAVSTGKILGSELSALGINMLFGPSLDVLDLDYSEGNEALGTRSFGENPYWVGKMGQAYIEGVHTGSSGKLMVIATHFPGQGSSDRDPTREIAAIRKPYTSLLSTDLAAFFDVTGGAANPSGTADGLLAGHLRYEGLQGTIRSTTRPFSLDATALDQVLALPALSTWRQNGGILVSDNLGSAAIHQFYDPKNISFDARQVARNAVISGMDLLYLDDFIATGDPDQTTTVVRTLEFFAQKYKEDEAFAQRVDTSVKRILTKKYSLYPEFNTTAVTPKETGLSILGQSSAVTFEVAQRSVTLLHPQAADYVNVLPSPPGLGDRTVFFTDDRLFKQCSACTEYQMIPSDALRKSVIKLYGPDASGDTAQYLLSTFSFNDLLSMLNGEEQAQTVEDELRAADWVVFAFMDMDPNLPASMALKNLLKNRTDLLIGKNTIAFAFNAPYYLDATEISKLSAYYAVYSKIPSFTDVAARILFQEIAPVGRLPISLPAVGYDLDYVTLPIASQNINLSVDTSVLSEESNISYEPIIEDTSQPPIPSFRTGDTIPLTTGLILDRNHNPVPDGTPVLFSFAMDGETDFVQTISSTTVDGIAKTQYLIPSEGRLEISAASGDAINSNKLILNIQKGEAAVITVIVPTTLPTRTPSPLPPTPSETPSPTPVSTAVPADINTPKGSDWLLAMVLIWASTFGIYVLYKKRINMRWAIRWGLLAAFGGLCAYIVVGLGIAGANRVLLLGQPFGIMLPVLLGIGTGWLSGWLWYRNFTKRVKRSFPPETDRQ